MRQDVAALSRFYASPQGKAALAMLDRRLSALWPDLDEMDVLGLGYAAPLMERYADKARRAVAFMPEAQGVARWPNEGRCRALLGDEARLPIMDAVFDRAIAAHYFEESDSLRASMAELWRVLAPSGRAVLILASRRGLWARADNTPFGHGRSFSRRQLTRILADARFEATGWARALYVPPIGWGPVVRAAPAWERAGERFWPRFGGVIMVEVVKRTVAPIGVEERRVRFAPAHAQGAARPA